LAFDGGSGKFPAREIRALVAVPRSGGGLNACRRSCLHSQYGICRGFANANSYSIEQTTMTTVALVDDHPVFRQGLRLLFELHGDPQVVAETSHAHEAVEIVRKSRPDVVLLDVVFPDGVSGVSVAHELLRRNPAERILFVSMVKDVARVADALESGALGYATKDQSAEDLVEAVRTVAAGKSYLAATLQSDRIDAQRKALRENARLGNLGSLTARERQIFEMTVAGLTAAAIGQKLSISRRTVETHRARILSKLGVHSAAELVRIAARAGML